MKLLLTALLGLSTFAGFAQTRSPVVSFDKPASVAPATGYSHTVRVNLGSATMLLVSGQVALDKQGNVVGRGDAPKQFEQVFANIKSLVEEAGGTMSQVVKLNYYLLDMAQLPQLRAVRDQYINPAAPPASTAVQVSKLFREGLLVEIEATAIRLTIICKSVHCLLLSTIIYSIYKVKWGYNLLTEVPHVSEDLK